MIITLFVSFPPRNTVEYNKHSMLNCEQDTLHPNKLSSGQEHVVLALGDCLLLFKDIVQRILRGNKRRLK
jgi:hypothetical protein